jgi:hypothetical protein
MEIEFKAIERFYFVMIKVKNKFLTAKNSQYEPESLFGEQGFIEKKQT